MGRHKASWPPHPTEKALYPPNRLYFCLSGEIGSNTDRSFYLYIMYDLYIIQCFLCWIVYMKSAAPFHDHAYSSRRCRVHNRSVYPYRRINMRIYVIRTTLELLHIIMVSSSISLGWTSHDLPTTQTLIKVSTYSQTLDSLSRTRPNSTASCCLSKDCCAISALDGTSPGTANKNTASNSGNAARG
jgi:hypothetical protein